MTKFTSILRYTVASALTLATVCLPGSVAHVRAEDPDWPVANNSNALAGPDNSIDLPITFPLAGLADGFINGTPTADAADGFCYNGQPRAYSTAHCISQLDAHRGMDFTPLTPQTLTGGAGSGYAANGVVPVVAPVGGLVEFSGCLTGNGKMVKIVGSYNLRLQLQHMSQLAYVTGATAVEGHRIGYAAATHTMPCTDSYYGAPHLHFELRLPDGSDAYNNPVDPWTSLRTAYARPGLWADGTVDAAMRDWWVYAGAVYGTGYVGFPSVRDAIGSNVQYRANGFNVAAVQYLGNGAATYDATTYTTGALTHLYGAPGAAWIRTWWYKKWRLIGSYNSYLGFPTGGDNGTIQFFQGGCIKVVGTTATASPFGGASCS